MLLPHVVTGTVLPQFALIMNLAKSQTQILPISLALGIC